MMRRVYREEVEGDAWAMAKGRLFGACLAASILLVVSIVVVGVLS